MVGSDVTSVGLLLVSRETAVVGLSLAVRSLALDLSFVRVFLIGIGALGVLDAGVGTDFTAAALSSCSGLDPSNTGVVGVFPPAG